MRERNNNQVWVEFSIKLEIKYLKCVQMCTNASLVVSVTHPQPPARFHIHDLSIQSSLSLLFTPRHIAVVHLSNQCLFRMSYSISGIFNFDGIRWNAIPNTHSTITRIIKRRECFLSADFTELSKTISHHVRHPWSICFSNFNKDRTQFDFEVVNGIIDSLFFIVMH